MTQIKSLFIGLLTLTFFATLIAAELPDSLGGASYPAPEKKEMTLIELTRQLFDLDGKVIETKITGADFMKQIKENQYSITCYYYMGSDTIIEGEYVTFNSDAKKFSEDLAKRDLFNGSSKKVYFFVHNKKLEAIGRRYKKSSGEYSW